jgi:transcriptional regulator with XRE-family HTH domain
VDEAEPDYGVLVNAILADQKTTAYELAKRSGLTQQAILDITKGNRPNPRIETIRKLLVAAGKSWGWLDDQGAVPNNSTDEKTVKLGQLLDELDEIGQMHEARMSPAAVRMIAVKLRRLLDLPATKKGKKK